MKNYNITNRLSPKAKKVIANTIENHDHFKKAYFWSAARNSHTRRSNEKRFEKDNPSYKLIQGTDIIEVSPSYSESCNNVYYSLNILVNDVVKDVRVLKKILK